MQDADYRRLVEDSPLATVLVDRGPSGWRAAWANRAATDLFDGLLDRPLAEVVHPEDLADVVATLDRGARDDRTAHEWRWRGADGRDVTVEVLVGGGTPDGVLSLSCWDVTQHVERTRDLAHRATHDRLTGLPTRELFEDRWELARSRARRSGDVPVVAFCDVDDLKQLNDEHGHLVGDQALVRIAGRLAGTSRAGDTVARFGGDEFVVLVEAGDVDPAALGRRLREAVADVPLEVPGHRAVPVRCSVGLVQDDLTRSTAEVLASADRRMYEEKRRHRHA
ncbi:GGDEF domain-containing protein [Kineococcus endophyticus]|uniref:GGDEF domain-containing protein n=1 Tax=Kineococcus endophyticus TaxID=1181883 RepID=A0ABV3P9I8_9ACTN